MNQILKKTLCLATLLSSAALADVVPYIAPRGQHVNAARDLVLWQSEINLFDMDCYYGAFAITPEFTRSFRPERIAQCLFCDALTDDCCGTTQSKCARIAVEGSTVSGRNSKALLAEYFGLPDDYKSVITFEPRIDNFLVDFNFFFGLDEWYEGMWFRFNFPICHTRWDLNFCERNITAGERPYNLGYFSNQVNNPEALVFFNVARSNLVGTAEGFFTRGETPTLGGDPVATFQPLKHAKMSKCRLDETKLAGFNFALGWNFCMDCDYHVGLGIRASAPTGTRPEGCWLFEPVVGNGHHWELGAMFTSHWCAWRSEDECDDFTMYLDANITHLFKAHQCRTFDLCCKPLSRYMLAMKMKKAGEAATRVYDDDAQTRFAPYQFDNEYAPVANLTTIPVDVSASIQGDVVLKFAYTHNCFQFDFGYNFWGRSCEKICPRCDCLPFEEGTWALKGDAYVYGFDFIPTVFVPRALSATESNATAFTGTNKPAEDLAATPDPTYWSYNPGIDNKKPAYENDGTKILNNEYSIPFFRQINSSFDPVLITKENIDFDGAQTRGMSHKIFGNIGYIWKDGENCWIPFFGVGAEVEFGSVDKRCCCEPCKTDSCSPCGTSCKTSCNTSSSCCDTDSSCCKTCALSQWGVWVKGGASWS